MFLAEGSAEMDVSVWAGRGVSEVLIVVPETGGSDGMSVWAGRLVS